MDMESTTSTPFSILQGNSVALFQNAIHVSLPSEDFAHITIQANAAADHLMNTPDSDFSQGHHPKPSSIGILDLDQEGDAFYLESEDDIFGLDCLSEPDTQQWTDPPPSVTNEDGRPDSSRGSVDVRTLSLELQEALRVAEMEVAELQSQVVSKTQHLEMAQKALVEYEDEVHCLRQQLKELADGGDKQHIRRMSCDDFVRDLCRVTSGTHRIRQSLGDSDGSASFSKQHLETLKENYEQLSLENKSLNDEILGLKGHCEELTIENRSLNSENRTLKGTMEKLKQSTMVLSHHDNRVEDMEDEIRSLNKEKSRLKTQLLQAQEELMCVLAETPDADEEVTTYRRRLKEAQEERDVLRRDLECAKADLASIKSELSLSQNRPSSSGNFTNRSDDERVLQLREVLNSKLMEHPEILQREESEESDRENLDAKEQISALQEALSLALEAKSLLEQKMATHPTPSDGLRGILEDISSLKESFQIERRMALRERTENENLILNLQQERDALLLQMDCITEGLHGLEGETSRLQKELGDRKKSADDYRNQAERRIRELEIDNAAFRHKLAQVREALDLCLEAKRELEIRAQYSDVVLSEWIRCFGHATMEAEDNFTVILRRRVDSNDIDRVRQAALQAIEHLERLQEETQRCMDWSSASVEAHCETPKSPSVEPQESNRMVTVTSNQLRMLRRDLRDVTQQRDEAMNLLKRQKDTDARRFGEIQELQTELNAALDQYEQLLPKFHEVINGKRELEGTVQSLQQEVEREAHMRKDMEDAVVGLLEGCQRILKWPESGSSFKKQPLIDIILSTKTELDVYYRSTGKRSAGLLQPSSSSKHSEGSASSYRHPDLRPLTEHLRSMVDKERDLRRYFDSQTERLSKLRVDTEQRSRWIKRTQSGNHMNPEDDRPASEMQIQERTMMLQKLQMKDDEIAELLNELTRIPSMDEETQRLLKGLDGIVHRGRPVSHPATQELGERLNRLQECAGSLEEQLMTVKSENKELKNERQMLLERIQSHL